MRTMILLGEKQAMTYLGKLQAYPQIGIFKSSDKIYLVNLYQRKWVTVLWFLGKLEHTVYEISEEELKKIQLEEMDSRRERIQKVFNKVMAVTSSIVMGGLLLTRFQLYSHQPEIILVKSDLSVLNIQIIFIVFSVIVVLLNFFLKYANLPKNPLRKIDILNEKKAKFYDDNFFYLMVIWTFLSFGALVIFFSASQAQYLILGLILLYMFVGTLGGGACRVIRANSVKISV